jgi:hypothetical protein
MGCATRCGWPSLIPTGRDVNPRWPFYASVAVLRYECMVCFVVGSIEWGERGGAQPSRVHRVPSPTIGLGWWLLLRMQVGVFVLALIEGVLTDLGWFYFSGLPLLTLFLLFAFRKAQARLKQPVERNLTAF